MVNSAQGRRIAGGGRMVRRRTARGLMRRGSPRKCIRPFRQDFIQGCVKSLAVEVIGILLFYILLQGPLQLF